MPGNALEALLVPPSCRGSLPTAHFLGTARELIVNPFTTCSADIA